MIGKLNKSPIFYKYLASFVAVLLIPLLTLGISGYEQMVNVIHHEVTVGHQDRLVQLKDHVDAKLAQMNKIAAEIATNPDLTPYALNGSFYQAYEAKALLNYKMANEFLHEVLLYVRGGNYLYSSVSTYEVPRFINDIYRYRDWSEAEFRRTIETSQEAVFRPAEEVVQGGQAGRYVTYVVPVPLKSREPHGTVLFVIPESALLAPDLIARNGNTVILDEQLRVMASLKRDDYLQRAEFIRQAAGADRPDSQIAKVDGKDYYVSHIRSKTTGWTYMTMLPVGEVMKPVHDVRNRWLRNLVLILAAGSLIVYGLMRVNYHPIRELAKWAEAHWGVPERKADELAAVRTVIDRMGHSNRELGEKLQSSRSAVREHLLLKLLKGEFASVDEFNERGKEVGLSFTHGRYRVVLFETAQHSAPDVVRTLKETVAAADDGRVEAYAKDGLEDRRLPVLLSTALEDAELGVWLENLHRTLRDVHGIAATMGVGNAYEDVGLLGKSFLEASTAVDYKLIKGNGKLIFFREMMEGGNTVIAYPTQELEQLELLIKQGNAEQIETVLGNIAARIRDSGASLFAARCLIFDVVNTVMKAITDMNALVPATREHMPNALSFVRFDTVEELTEQVAEACIGLCRIVESSRTEGNEPLIGSLLSYLEANYADPDFSVQQLAARFSLSASYVSRYFKERTGRNVSDYLHQLRVDEAKRLLAQEDVSVKEIVERIGYYDVSSFIRKFKRSVGVTPGEYRRLHRGM